MAIKSSSQRGKRIIEFDLSATLVPASTTEFITVPVEGVDRVMVHLVVAVAALTGFAIKAKVNAKADADILYNAAGDFTSPSGALVDASGDLTTLAIGTGWFILDTKGLDSIIIAATSGGTATLAIEGGGT